MIKNNTILIIFFMLAPLPVFSETVLVDWRSEWAYFKGRTEPSQPATIWRTTGFNDSVWLTGPAPFRYGDGTGGTLLSDMQGTYSTCYIRKNFFVDEDTNFDEIRLSIDYDDGFVIWINGELLMQANAPQNLAYNQFATANHESGEYETYTFATNSINMLPGINTIAVQGFNVSNTSSDFYLDLKLEGVVKLPATDPVSISVSSGFFHEPFVVSLTSAAPGDTIRYTLDGSDPAFSVTALTVYAPASVTIDPGSVAGGRARTGGVVLRASKFSEGYDPGQPATRTYLFLRQIIDQHTHPGGSWPASNINGQWIDLPMDARITNHANYKDLMVDALLDIPTISMVIDPGNLFDAGTGIYVNARFSGRNWERPGNLELINPDGSPGFNEDAGIRIRGGWSRHPEFPKHAFRIFFRSEYGAGRLRYPLFGDEGTDSYDKFDLRTSQNYSWSKGGSEGVHNTMNRDVFSRDVQRDMGQPYTRSRYYHLYINGLYWGIFQSQERAEARFAESYLGGNREDYDVVKVEVGDDWNLYDIEATDGNTDAWEAIWNMCQKGFEANDDYFNLIGCHASGEPDMSGNVWVDIDNLIDYMLIIFYGGNFDAPVSKFRGNQDPNNFYAIYNRNNPRDGFKFFAHDSEHTLLTDAVGPGAGLQENRVNIARAGMYVGRFEKFHPQWLHHRLSQNAEYRMRFADRVYRHFFNHGVFNPDSCIARFRKTSDQLDLAIIAESARWGDVGVSNPRTRDTDWLLAVNKVVNNFMPVRTEIVLNQIRAENLYPEVHPPVVRHNGNVVTQHTLSVFEPVRYVLSNPNHGGTVYYTTDGTDPRLVGGSIAPAATAASAQQAVSVGPGNTLKARVLSGNVWSALREIAISDAALFQYLKITELHYNPAGRDTLASNDMEFLELKNTGKTALSLSGLRFSEGISGEFQEGTVLNPGEFFVAVSDTLSFYVSYGMRASMQYSGNLSNSGEKIVLETANKDIVLSFTYADRAPWPTEADGDGYSLVSAAINPTGDPNVYTYWTRSKNIDGSPFADDGDSSYVIDLQQLVAGKAALQIDLDAVFSNHAAGTLTYAVDHENPQIADVQISGNSMHISPLKQGGTQIQVTASDGMTAPVVVSFRAIIYPEAYISADADFVFDSWDANTPEYTYPAHMLFLQTAMSDPGLEAPLLYPYHIAHDDYHSNDQELIGFPYALSGRTRINGLGDQGISFINTGRQRDLGGALLALDTRGVSNLQLSWTAGTILRNERIYAIRLQYRTSLTADFKNLVVRGQVQEYAVHEDGHIHVFNAVELPEEMIGKEYVQLLWRYYHVSGSSGPRSQLRLDDIHIGTSVDVTTPEKPDFGIYAHENVIYVNFAGLESSSKARVRVFNLMGQVLLTRALEAGGQHSISTQLPAGLYVVTIESNVGTYSQKVFISH